jgi:hypothetical protein
MVRRNKSISASAAIHAAGVPDMIRSKKVKMTLTLEIDVEVSGICVPAQRGSPQTMHGPGDPPEPACVEDMSVMLGKIDIFEELTYDQKESLAESLLDNAGAQ